MNEVWKDIRGYEGLYLVSDIGRVKTNNGLIRKIKPSPFGYERMTLYKDGVYKSYQMHRLVAEAFIGSGCANREINHIDGNKKNNAAINLEWVNRSQNVLHAMRIGLSNPTANLPKDTQGENNGRAKLTVDDVITIREMYKAKVSSSDIANRYGLAKAYVWRVASGKTWKLVA